MPSIQGVDTEAHPASNSTMALHKEKDGNPAITLTTYLMEPPERLATKFLSTSRKLFSPEGADEALVNWSNPCCESLHKAGHVTDDIELVFDRTESEKTISTLEKPKIELDENFERLKSDCEQKRGSKWAPLRSFDHESWAGGWDRDDPRELTKSSRYED